MKAIATLDGYAGAKQQKEKRYKIAPLLKDSSKVHTHSAPNPLIHSHENCRCRNTERASRI